MSPKIVDKKYRRKEIAYASFEYINKVGIQNFSIDGLIKFLNIGKSSLYHYFKSKDEIIYEIFYLATQEYMRLNARRICDNQTFKEKLEVVFDLYLVPTKENMEMTKFYKEYLLVNAENKTTIMNQYNEELMSYAKKLLISITEDEIVKGNIDPKTIHFVDSMITTADGMMMYSFALKEFNLAKELQHYIDSLFDLVKIEQ